MFDKESVVSVIRPVWILGQIFGLSYSYATERMSNEKQTLCRILLKIVYSCVSAMATLCLSFYNFDVTINANNNLIIQIADILIHLSRISAATGTVLMSLIYQDRLTTVMKNINEIDVKLKKFPQWTDYKWVNIYSYTMIVSLFISWTYFYISYISTCSAGLLNCSIIFLIVYTITKIYDVNLLRFQVQMCIMWHQLGNINNNILQFSQENTSGSISFLKEIQRIDTIGSLKRLYMDVLKLSREINKIYSISLLLIVTNQFILMFSSLYFCFFGYYLAGVYRKPRTFKELVVPLMSSIHPIGQLMITVTICQLTVNQSKYTGLLIYRIPLSRNTRMLMKKINLFALHMVHKDFDITAAGFFSINSSLLLMIVGAVTVYLVMFIQFDLAAGKKTVN